YEKEKIVALCQKLGILNKIQGIVTRGNLIDWYEQALRGKYGKILGIDLLQNLREEFNNEFPYSKLFDIFYMRERSYDGIQKSSSLFWLDD
ncbi:MAG: HaeII family restriction endonuclease, partial [bacterium]